MTSKENEKEDLGIKIGTKKQALWERVKKEAAILIEQSEDNLLIQKEILQLADRKIKEEKKDLNTSTT